MSGHSHSKNIMHQKGASDAKKAKIFNKIAREIMVSCKLGAPDPAHNPRLRAAIIEARGANMTRDRIERAIKASQGGAADKGHYEEIRYEGYGPGGCALIVEALTDNRNRTASEVRSAFSKHGCALGEMNSVSFMFERVGQIIYPAAVASADDMLEAVIDAGGNNVDSDEEEHDVTTSVEDFISVRDKLMEKFKDPSSAKLTWIPKNTAAVPSESVETLLDLIDVLEDDDDVQSVVGNYEISDDDWAKYGKE